MNEHYGLKKKGKSLVLGFPYSAQLVKESKELGSSKYDPVTKTRKYSYYSTLNLIDFCKKHDLPIEEDIFKIAETIDTLPEVEGYKGGLKVRILPNLNLPENIQHNKTKDWYYIPSISFAQTIQWAQDNGLRIEDGLVEEANHLFLTESTNYKLGTALESSPISIDGLLSAPLPLQWVPAKVIQKNKKAILADEQGLGKTLEALMTARITDDNSQKLVIICPDKLTLNWVDEMGTHFEPQTFSPWIAKSRTASEIPDDVDTVVIGWTIFNYWVDTLMQWSPDMVIADEGHYGKAGKVISKSEEQLNVNANGEIVKETVKMKVGGSHRGDAKFAIFRYVDQHGGKILDLTGTPMPSRPKELYPALQALGIEGHFGNTQYYNLRYCDGKKVFIGGGRGPMRDGYVWDFSGASNTLELNTRLLSTGHYIRRTKEHLVQANLLPNKLVDEIPFYDIDGNNTEPIFIDGDPEIMKEYVKLEYGLTQELMGAAEMYARKLRLPMTHPKVLQKVAGEGNKRKDALFQLRRLAGLAGMQGSLEYIQRYLNQNEKVLVVAHHRDVVDFYHERIAGATKIQGSMTTKRIEEEKAKFNAEGFDHPAMILALEAGKTGHTLCKQPDKKCAIGINTEQSFTPSDDYQVQDRIWRLGQDREVKFYNIIVKNTVNEHIYRMRMSKVSIVRAVVDGKDSKSAQTEKSAIGDLAIDLATRGMEKESK